MKNLVTFAILLMSAGHAPSQETEKYVTSRTAVLCVRFTDIKEAIRAVASSDTAWMKSLDCAMVNEDLPVIVIDQINSTSDLDPWKVRITLPDGRGASVWGPVFAFKKAAPATTK